MAKHWLKWPKTSLNSPTVVMLTIFITSLLFRVASLGASQIYSDEITWMVRGKEVVYAIIHLNKTYFDNAWWNKTYDTEAIGLPLVIVSGLSQLFLAGSSKFSLNLLSDITASRLPVAVISSILPVAIYYFVLKLADKKTALLASIFYLVNPITLGLDRWIVHDSFLTLFSFLSISSFLLTAENKKPNILPGVFLALAFLTKPNGILIGISWLAYFVLNYKSKPVLKSLLSNTFTALVFITILWPKSWNAPVFSFFEYLYRQTQLVGAGMGVYYLGQVTTHPNWTYYLFQFAMRLPEIIVLNLLIGLLVWPIVYKQATSKKRKITVSVAVYCLIFLLLISLSPKKLGVRYALPLFPWLVIFAAGTLRWILDKTSNKLLTVVTSLFAFFSLVFPLTFFPDYYLYYNQFAGGTKGAQRYDMVGFCASSKPAFEYLNSVSYDGNVYVAGCSESAPYYSGIRVTKDYKQADSIIVETYLANQHPEDPIFEFIKTKTLIKSFADHGAVITEIYQ